MFLQAKAFSSVSMRTLVDLSCRVMGGTGRLIFSSLYTAICAARTEYLTVNTTSSGISTNWLTKARFLEFEGTGSGRTLIVGWAAASEAMESVGVGIIAVFGAAGGACGPNAADQTKSHHQPRLPQRCSLFRPFCVSTTQRPTSRRNIHNNSSRPPPAYGADPARAAQSRSGPPQEMQSR